MMDKTFNQAVFPIITFGDIGVHMYENDLLLHTCFRDFVGSFKGRTIVDSKGSLWMIKSAVEIECVTPFWIRLFRAAVVRMQLETAFLPPIPFNKLRRMIIAHLKKKGWASIMTGYVAEFTSNDSKKIIEKMAQATNIIELFTILRRMSLEASKMNPQNRGQATIS